MIKKRKTGSVLNSVYAIAKKIWQWSAVEPKVKQKAQSEGCGKDLYCLLEQTLTHEHLLNLQFTSVYFNCSALAHFSSPFMSLSNFVKPAAELLPAFNTQY